MKGIGSGIAARIDGFITRRNGEQRNTQGAAPAATAQDDTEEPIVLEYLWVQHEGKARETGTNGHKNCKDPGK